ncbi:MAG: hypothetical protein QOI07_2614 [Verrucomicrobiota bacterium]|jgi:hypothetical protein
MIFVSHASPEDNEFARWLSVRLAASGFEVWSDVTKLLGGEKFWTEIETAIKQHAVKFLLCVSRHPIRSGVLREIDWAIEAESEKSRDIVVPLKIDSTSFSEFPRDLGSYVNSIRFDHGWAEGLEQLLAMLKRDGVTPRNQDGHSIVRESWNRWFPVDEGLGRGRDVCVSNVFPTLRSPPAVWYHPASRHIRRGFKTDQLPVVAETFGNGFVSFCTPTEMRDAARRFAVKTGASYTTDWKTFIAQGVPALGMGDRTARRIASALIKRAFERHAERRGFQRYGLANDNACYWLTSGFLPHDEGSYEGPDGKRHKRGLVGFKSLTANKEGIKAKRIWHFAVQGVPTFEPDEALILKTHVVFSPDGKTPYESDSYQHRARRNQGKNWWNDRWRDRLLTMMNVLAGEAKALCIPVGANSDFAFSTAPVRFISDTTYLVVDRQQDEDLPDDDDFEMEEVAGVAAEDE